MDTLLLLFIVPLVFTLVAYSTSTMLKTRLFIRTKNHIASARRVFKEIVRSDDRLKANAQILDVLLPITEQAKSAEVFLGRMDVQHGLDQVAAKLPLVQPEQRDKYNDIKEPTLLVGQALSEIQSEEFGKAILTIRQLINDYSAPGPSKSGFFHNIQIYSLLIYMTQALEVSEQAQIEDKRFLITSLKNSANQILRHRTNS